MENDTTKQSCEGVKWALASPFEWTMIRRFQAAQTCWRTGNTWQLRNISLKTTTTTQTATLWSATYVRWQRGIARIRRCCSNPLISPAGRAHSSKPAAAYVLLWAHARNESDWKSDTHWGDMKSGAKCRNWRISGRLGVTQGQCRRSIERIRLNSYSTLIETMHQSCTVIDI